MTVIGYQHSFLEKYLRVVEKADLSSNPYIDHFLTSSIHLTQDSNFVKRLVEYNVVK